MIERLVSYINEYSQRFNKKPFDLLESARRLRTIGLLTESEYELVIEYINSENSRGPDAQIQIL